MTRIGLGFGMACLGAMALTAATQQPFPAPPTPQNPIFRGGATLVAVDVYPSKDGHVVEGLTPSDFAVTEDGKPQTLEFFEFLKFDTGPADVARQDPQTAEEGERFVADPHHRAFVAYFDYYHLYAGGARNMREPVVEFLDRTIGPTDYFAALNPDVPISQLTFGQRTETIASEVEQYWPMAATATVSDIPMSAHEKWLRHCYELRFQNAHLLDVFLAELYPRVRMELVLDSLTSLTAKLASIREERTNVLLFSDGWRSGGPDESLLRARWDEPALNGRTHAGGAAADNIPADSQACDAELTRLAEVNYTELLRRLRDDALRRNVAFFPIEPDGLVVFAEHMTDAVVPPTFDQTDTGTLEPLRQLALSTNGDWIMRTNNIRSPLLALRDALSSYYLLGYYTTNTANDGKYRVIDVKVKAPGIKVAARHGYVANPTPVVVHTVASGPTPEGVALSALSALDHEPPLYATAVTSSTEVAVVVEVPERNAASVASGAEVRVTLGTSPGSGPDTTSTHLAPNARSALLRLPLGTGPGPWLARIDVGGSEGLSTALTVTRPPDGSLVSEPLLYRATPSPRSPLWPSAGHLFTRMDRVHAEWTLSGPLDNRAARLLDRRGQPLAVAVNLTESPTADQPKLAGDVTLAPLAPGDYVIELVVSRGPTTERHLTAIRIGT